MTGGTILPEEVQERWIVAVAPTSHFPTSRCSGCGREVQILYRRYGEHDLRRFFCLRCTGRDDLPPAVRVGEDPFGA